MARIKQGSIKKDRIKAAARLFHTLMSVFLNKRTVSNQTKGKIYNTVFVPTLTYASESEILTDRVKANITVMKMRLLIKIEGVSRLHEVRNGAIMESLSNIGFRKIEQRLSWFRHLARLKDDNLVKVIWEVGWDERRRRERLKKFCSQENARIRINK